MAASTDGRREAIILSRCEGRRKERGIFSPGGQLDEFRERSSTDYLSLPPSQNSISPMNPPAASKTNGLTNCLQIFVLPILLGSAPRPNSLPLAIVL